MAFNMDPKKCPMPTQDPNVRNKNFLEVALGYTEEQALDEAARCLNCKNHPCVSGCPVQVKIPEFIKKITEKDYEGAYQVIHETSSLPAVCGRVCPQETQCESKCVRGIKGEPVGIGRLERFVADWHNANVQEAPAKPAPNGHKVAVIGSGPSGLTCAGDLAKKGYDVTVFEALHLAGGVLVYGIPEFRLPKPIVQKEVDGLKALGVKVETNMVIGRVVSIDELMSEISGLRIGDRVRLVTELYKVYSEFHPESFDKFYFWGEMLLTDFDTIDKYLIDADMLFRNLADIKELEADVSYLSPVQLKIIAFWANFTDETSLSEEKRRFLAVWQTLGPVYRTFRERLRSLGMAYTGMVHRAAAALGVRETAFQVSLHGCRNRFLLGLRYLLYGQCRPGGRYVPA